MHNLATQIPLPGLLRQSSTALEYRSDLPCARVFLVREFEPSPQASSSCISSADIYEMMKSYFARLDREAFVVLLLDNKNKVIAWHVVSVGSLTSSIVHPREVLKPVVLSNAAAVALMHNHPSGDPTPSREDVEITRRLRELFEVMGVRCLDHVIFGAGRYCSMLDEGYW